MNQAEAKATMHPRNKNADGYDFAALTQISPGLAKHVVTTPAGTPSIDFSKPAAVKSLNRALLMQHYGIHSWEIPAGYLCPPVPGRADYIHHLADLLTANNRGELPVGNHIRVLDIGVGANCIYPIIGNGEYGWRFLGVDIDEQALNNVRAILAKNPTLAAAVDLRHQAVPENTFSGLLRSGEHFDLAMCNPPFHASPGDAEAASQRKWNQLGKPANAKSPAGSKLNFGGQGSELWCSGGERAFLQLLVEQSAGIPKRCLWFSTLVSKADNLRHIEAALKKARVVESKIIPMAQGQKQSRLVAWTFLGAKERVQWRKTWWPLPTAPAPASEQAV